MIRSLPTVILFVACQAAYAQPTEALPSFEVASVKPAPPPDPNMMRVGSTGGPGTSDPGMMRFENYSMSNLLTYAYDIKHYQLTGPAWIDSERYEIVAKLPAGATKAQVRLMMQSLLMERFHLAIHHESKEMPMYDLVVAKGGSKLKEWVEQPAPADGAVKPAPGAPDGLPKFSLGKDGYPALPPGTGMMMMNGKARRQGRETIAEFASWLSAQSGRPVSDTTGLKGKYDISIYWAADSGRAAPPNADGMASAPEDTGPTLFGALQEQLGLKLESKKGPVDTIMVDRLEKAPIDN